MTQRRLYAANEKTSSRPSFRYAKNRSDSRTLGNPVIQNFHTSRSPRIRHLRRSTKPLHATSYGQRRQTTASDGHSAIPYAPPTAQTPQTADTIQTDRRRPSPHLYPRAPAAVRILVTAPAGQNAERTHIRTLPPDIRLTVIASTDGEIRRLPG